MGGLLPEEVRVLCATNTSLYAEANRQVVVMNVIADTLDW